MSDKKNEDYVVRMPDSKEGGLLDRPIIPRNYAAANHMHVPASISRLDNSPGLSIVAYCLASISMTVVNKYVVSGNYWNMNFLYLAIQVCLLCCCPFLSSVTPRLTLPVVCLHSCHCRWQASRPDHQPLSL